MLASSVLRLTLSVIALSALAFGDLASIVTMNSVKITNNPNDFLDAVEVEVIPTKRSSQFTIKLPTKQELPPTMMMKLTIQLTDQDPFEYDITICDALSDEVIGKSFGDVGLPKDEYPKECPFGAGDWTIFKWNPPTEKIPPGVPDGPFTGKVRIMEEGKEPAVLMEFEGELSHKW